MPGRLRVPLVFKYAARDKEKTHLKEITCVSTRKKLQRRAAVSLVVVAVLLVLSLARATARPHEEMFSSSSEKLHHQKAPRPLFLHRQQVLPKKRGGGDVQVREQHRKASDRVWVPWKDNNDALNRVADLRRLFDQQRMATSHDDAASPTSAGLRAAAAAALDAASEPVLDRLVAARKEASEAIEQKIYRNQFPEDCDNARLLLCSIDKDCGFACQMHHGVHLLALALATNRTLVLYAEQWRYGKGVRGEGGGDEGGGGAIDENDNSDDNNELDDPNVWARSDAPAIHTDAPLSAWESVFERVTHCATRGDDWLATLPQFRPGQEHPEARAVIATVIDDGQALPFYDPPAVPRDVAQMVSAFHSRPEVWWVGALARFLLRPARAEEAKEDEEYNNKRDRGDDFRTSHDTAAASTARRLGLVPGKYIGMHVRRTDKIEKTLNDKGEWPAEAARHELGEYVEAAEAWHAEMMMRGEMGVVFETETESKSNSKAGIVMPTAAKATKSATGPFLASSFFSPYPDHHHNNQPLTIYLATDDAALAKQAPRLFPNINWVTNPAGATEAALRRRNSLASLRGLVNDLYFLSYADAVVGSFTSQVSRLSYELLQHVHSSPDASLRYHSVDSQWYFGGGPPMRWCLRRWSSSGKGRGKESAGDEANTFSSHYSKPSVKAVFLCEADVAAVKGRVRCRLDGDHSDGAWIEVPAAALERCAF